MEEEDPTEGLLGLLNSNMLGHLWPLLKKLGLTRVDHLHSLPDQELEQLPLGIDDLLSLGNLVREKKGKPVGSSRLVKMDEQPDKKD